ncbi:MAG: hypothetical protein M5R41_11000 [Bacteroidia bacterium]|nr:hypothetical protein [Bacteroidia bacterium]
MTFTKSFPRIVPAALLVLAVVFLSACADSIVSECDLPDGPLPVSARFSDIEAKVFAVSCATAGCHGGANPQAGMDLSAGRSYDALVNVNSLYFPAQKRVTPGNSAESVLISLLRREKQPAMPPAGALEAAIIDSIAVWIDRGAPRD